MRGERLEQHEEASPQHATTAEEPCRANVTLRKGSAAAGEIDRLRSSYPPARAKVLHVTNIPDIDARAELLTTRQAMALRSKFGFVGGSWCCAPHADSKKGQPQSAHFSLMGGVGRFG